MNEIIRATIHDGLEVEEPPGLRARVIAAVPMERRHARRSKAPQFRAEWTYSFVALLLTAALVAGLVYLRVGGLPATNSHSPTASASRLRGPSGIAVAPDGTIYVADYIDNRVFRVQSDGTLVTIAGGGSLYEGPAIKSNLFGPVGLAVDSNGDLFIADNPGSAIQRVDPTGNLTTYFAWHSAGAPNDPWGLAVDSSGLVYASLGGGVFIIRPDRSVASIDLSGVSSPAVWPGYLAMDARGNLYLADMAPTAGQVQPQVPPSPGGCRILQITPDHTVTVIAGTGQCGYSGDGGPATSAQLNDPKGLAFDSAGNLYFADSHNHRVRRIDTHGIITTVAGTGTEGDSGDGGPAIRADLAYLGGIAARGPFLYVTEEETASGAFGAVRLIDLRDGTISTVVSTRSRVVS